MNKPSSIIWLSVILLLLLPTSLGRLFINMAGGIAFIILIFSLFIVGVGWLSWRSLKSNMKTCANCGSQYFSTLDICPACGSIKSMNLKDSSNNIPASAATIDIDAEESK